MRGCSFCGEETEELHICPDCHRKYCSKHKQPIDHDCLGDNYLEDL